MIDPEDRVVVALRETLPATATAGRGPNSYVGCGTRPDARYRRSMVTVAPVEGLHGQRGEREALERLP